MTTRPLQRSIERDISFSGKALQTGSKVEVTCRPAEADSGIRFIRTDLESKPSICLGGAVFSDVERRSTVGLKGAEIQTVEHFLAALWSLKIDNITVEISGDELPALDGSALGFLAFLRQSPVKEYGVIKKTIKIDEEILITEGLSSIAIFPADHLSVSYRIDYPLRSIEKETFFIDIDENSFEREIAPARTFCLKKEADALLKAGLGKGATLENTLVMDEDGPVGSVPMRFKNEPLRHKILDIIGDLYLLGIPVIGKVKAVKSGHKLNGKLIKLIYEKYCL